MYGDEIKEEARRLRSEEHATVGEIAKKLGVAKSTAYNWIRDCDLPESVRQEMSRRGGQATRGWRKYDTPEESSIHRILVSRGASVSEQAKVAEAAVLLRLVTHGYSVYGSPFDGDKVDWVVDTKSGPKRVQVRMAKIQKHGAPSAKLLCSAGRGGSRRYSDDEVDIFVAYDIFSGTAYVWLWEELTHNKCSISCATEARERWDKLD